MKYLGLAGLLVITLSGCSSPTQEDSYLDASFQLCNTEVKVFSTSDDGKVRIVCADGSKFAMDNAKDIRYHARLKRVLLFRRWSRSV